MAVAHYYNWDLAFLVFMLYQNPISQRHLFFSFCLLNFFFLVQDVVTSICFGRYGREDGTLIMTTKGTVKKRFH